MAILAAIRRASPRVIAKLPELLIKDLKVHAEYRQEPLQYCGKAEQNDENFEQISKSPVSHKLVD